jgi:uncharacterized repeat protein (TIGR03803 family)
MIETLKVRKLGNCRTACALVLLFAATPITLPAQTFTTLANFNGTNGRTPVGALAKGPDGNLYGTTRDGGAYSNGTAFRVTPTGTLKTIYSFCAETNCPDGHKPFAGLVLAADGDFYGTTYIGGAYLYFGTVFKITPSSTLTTLHSFAANPTDGSQPYAGLVQGTDGNFYGTTSEGGTEAFGAVFKMTPNGVVTLLHSFGYTADGADPYSGLIQATDGNFYGTTWVGGEGTYGGGGTVFKITPEGMLTTVYNFCEEGFCADGASPAATLVQGTDGDFYGTTESGGPDLHDHGTVFKIDSGGTLTTLHGFAGSPSDGSQPFAGLIQAADGNFYGTTQRGGTNNDGTVFKIDSSGSLSILHSFAGTDGMKPDAALVQGTDGNFYGTTQAGGANGGGTVFSLAVGLRPFVETLPTLAAVGTPVRILGTNLTGTTSVTFNGTPATFRVVSATEITTTVPAGATTGTIQVVTPSGTLSSNVPFRVLP